MNQETVSNDRPAEFADTTIWAAWLYYVDELTQSDVAKRLNVSRVTAIKLLSEARDRGLVEIKVNAKLATQVELSRLISEQFNLKSATIIPNLNSGDNITRLGKAAANLLSDGLNDDDILAVAWGRTVLATAKSVPHRDTKKRLTVTQLSGSPDGLSADFSPELCSSLLANRLSARCVNILAPAMVSSAEMKTGLMQEPSISSQFDIIRSATKALFGIGELGKGSTIEQSKLHTPKVLSEAKSMGAKAVIMGRFIDGEGNEIFTSAHDHMIGVTVDELRSIPHRICVAGGTQKTAAILAALRGGLISHLVSDQKTAEEIIQM